MWNYHGVLQSNTRRLQFNIRHAVEIIGVPVPVSDILFRKNKQICIIFFRQTRNIIKAAVVGRNRDSPSFFVIWYDIP